MKALESGPDCKFYVRKHTTGRNRSRPVVCLRWILPQSGLSV
jgi:hypothetical protein